MFLYKYCLRKKTVVRYFLFISVFEDYKIKEKMKSQRITIYDIAEEAGVSITTVSRALSQSGKVKTETYKRIMSVVNKYNFRPNEAAKTLAETKSKIIGIMVSQIDNPFYANMFIWCERIADLYGYSAVLANSMGNLEYEHQLVERLYAQRVAAIIQLGGNVDECVSDKRYTNKVKKIMEDIPFVISGKLDGVNCCRIQINDITGINLAVEHLVGLGHRKIALIGGKKNQVPTFQKLQEFKRLVSRYKLDSDEELVCTSNGFTNEDGYECMERLIHRNKIPSGIIAINDFVAAGVIQSLVKHGLSVPDDVSILSFDDTYISRILLKGLTTVSYDYELVCSSLIAMAIARIENRDCQEFRLIEPSLICRDSTRSVKKLCKTLDS